MVLVHRSGVDDGMALFRTDDAAAADSPTHHQNHDRSYSWPDAQKNRKRPIDHRIDLKRSTGRRCCGFASDHSCSCGAEPPDGGSGDAHFHSCHRQTLGGVLSAAADTAMSGFADAFGYDYDAVRMIPHHYRRRRWNHHYFSRYSVAAPVAAAESALDPVWAIESSACPLVPCFVAAGDGGGVVAAADDDGYDDAMTTVGRTVGHRADHHRSNHGGHRSPWRTALGPDRPEATAHRGPVGVQLAEVSARSRSVRSWTANPRCQCPYCACRESSVAGACPGPSSSPLCW